MIDEIRSFFGGHKNSMMIIEHSRHLPKIYQIVDEIFGGY